MANTRTKSLASAWHFPKDAVTFLKDLKANNDREWFAKNKSIYERALKQPVKEFAELMEDELKRLTGRAHAAKIFRIHRDLRFSKDKRPYNTHLHMTFYPDGQKNSPSWFFALEPKKVILGAGVFGFEPLALEAYRKHVDGPDGKALATLLKRLEAKGARLSEPELKRVPREYDPDHTHASLLRRKGLTVWREFKDTKLATGSDAIADCGKVYAEFKPLNEWLLQALD